MGMVLAPLVSDKLEAWKAWNNEIQTTRKAEFDDFNNRMNITGHTVWLAQTPNGPMAIVSHEGPGENDFMKNLAISEHPFDVWFRNSISEFHGVDFSQPPPGSPPEKLMDWKSD